MVVEILQQKVHSRLHLVSLELGIFHFSACIDLNALNLDHCIVTDEWMETLVRFTKLDQLFLCANRLTNHSLYQFKRFSKLRTLYIDYSKNISAINPLGSLSTLQRLNIDSMNLQADPFVTLQRLTNLTELSLNGSNSNETIDLITKLTKLKILDIGSSWKLASLRPLQFLTKLEYLVLDCSSTLGDLEMDYLVTLTDLRYLSIEHCSLIGDPAIRNFTRLKKLAKLETWGCQISWDALNMLPGLNAPTDSNGLGWEGEQVEGEVAAEHEYGVLPEFWGADVEAGIVEAEATVARGDADDAGSDGEGFGNEALDARGYEADDREEDDGKKEGEETGWDGSYKVVPANFGDTNHVRHERDTGGFMSQAGESGWSNNALDEWEDMDLQMALAFSLVDCEPHSVAVEQNFDIKTPEKETEPQHEAHKESAKRIETPQKEPVLKEKSGPLAVRGWEDEEQGGGWNKQTDTWKNDGWEPMPTADGWEPMPTADGWERPPTSAWEKDYPHTSAWETPETSKWEHHVPATAEETRSLLEEPLEPEGETTTDQVEKSPWENMPELEPVTGGGWEKDVPKQAWEESTYFPCLFQICKRF